MWYEAQMEADVDKEMAVTAVEKLFSIRNVAMPFPTSSPYHGSGFVFQSQNNIILIHHCFLIYN